MQFPVYVPRPVRAHISAILESDQGWHAALDIAEAKVSEFDSLRKVWGNSSKVLDDIRRQEKEAVEHRDRLYVDVACLHRLAGDARMQPAYADLDRVLITNEHLADFIHAAWAARMNYGSQRDSLKKSPIGCKRLESWPMRSPTP